jgi:hypothetical protein
MSVEVLTLDHLGERVVESKLVQRTCRVVTSSPGVRTIRTAFALVTRADDGNRTRVFSLGSRFEEFEPVPHGFVGVADLRKTSVEVCRRAV